MDTRKLGLVLVLAGIAVTVVAVGWFFTAYADVMDMASQWMGDDYAARMLSCLYSTPQVCEGAAFLSEGPAYSPVLFWIGVLGVLGGIVIRFAAAGRPRTADAARGSEMADGEILGFIPPGQYARYTYILLLSGSVAGLVLPPLFVVAVGGLVLAVLGLTVYRTGMDAVNRRHLLLACAVFPPAGLLLYLTRGTFLFLLTGLALIACLYAAFNSYRHGRFVTPENAKSEFLAAFNLGAKGAPDDDQARSFESKE